MKEHYNKGIKNGRYIDGRTLKKYNCKDCRTDISDYRHKRCKKCQLTKHNNFKSNTKIVKDKIRDALKKLYKDKTKHPFYGRHCSKLHKLAISNANLGKSYKREFEEHHIYGKDNSDITRKVTPKIHRNLHHKLLNYIVLKYGFKEIDNYLKWFEKKYKVKICTI